MGPWVLINAPWYYRTPHRSSCACRSMRASRRVSGAGLEEERWDHAETRRRRGVAPCRRIVVRFGVAATAALGWGDAFVASANPLRLRVIPSFLFIAQRGGARFGRFWKVRLGALDWGFLPLGYVGRARFRTSSLASWP
jgi:hypothetical protein